MGGGTQLRFCGGSLKSTNSIVNINIDKPLQMNSKQFAIYAYTFIAQNKNAASNSITQIIHWQTLLYTIKTRIGDPEANSYLVS